MATLTLPSIQQIVKLQCFNQKTGLITPSFYQWLWQFLQYVGQFNPPPGGSVTSVNASGGITGLGFTGGPITTAGTLTLTGVLDISNGGTSSTNAAEAFNALSPMTTTGDMLYEISAGMAARLPIGSEGDVLTVVSGEPSWTEQTASNSDGLVDSANSLAFQAIQQLATLERNIDNTEMLALQILTNGYVEKVIAGTGISVSSATGNVTIANTGVTSFDTTLSGLIPNSPTTGNITLSGTLGILSGGTGQVTANAALNALLPTQTANEVLTTDGTNTSWQSVINKQIITTTGSDTITASSSPKIFAVFNGAQATETITFPTPGFDGQVVGLKFNAAMTALTLAGGAFEYAISAAIAGQYIEYIWDTTSSKWN